MIVQPLRRVDRLDAGWRACFQLLLAGRRLLPHVRISIARSRGFTSWKKGDKAVEVTEALGALEMGWENITERSRQRTDATSCRGSAHCGAYTHGI